MAFGVDDALLLLFGGGSLLSSLFGGGGNDQEQTTTSETTNPRYRSPLLGAMEPSIISALLGNAQSLGGAGMPGGVSRFGGDADSMFSDIISLLSKEWPTIMKEYNTGSSTANTTLSPCHARCASLKGGTGWNKCYSDCLKESTKSS